MVTADVAQDLRQLTIWLRTITGGLTLEPLEPGVGLGRAARELSVDEAVDHELAGRRPARLVVPERVRFRVFEIELGIRGVPDVHPVERAADRGALRVEARVVRAAEDGTVEAQRLPDAREAEVHDPVGGESIVEDHVAGDRRSDGIDAPLAAAEQCAARAIEVAADSRTKEAQRAVRAEAHCQIARQLGHVSGDRTS